MYRSPQSHWFRGATCDSSDSDSDSEDEAAAAAALQSKKNAKALAKWNAAVGPGDSVFCYVLEEDETEADGPAEQPQSPSPQRADQSPRHRRKGPTEAALPDDALAAPATVVLMTQTRRLTLRGPLLYWEVLLLNPKRPKTLAVSNVRHFRRCGLTRTEGRPLARQRVWLQVRGCDPASDRFRVVKFNLDSYAFDPQRPRAPQKNRVQFQVVGAKGVVCALSTVLDEEYGLALVNGRVQLLPWEVLDYVLAFLRPPGAQRT